MYNKRPPFLNSSSGIPENHVRLQFPWDAIKLVGSFALVTIISAVLYYVGTPHGWGVIRAYDVGVLNSPPINEVNFFDCLYFSVVTIATLGYGDYRPVSYGRIIAGGEVVAGIVMMGIFISRLVSRQQDRLTKRLVAGQLNSEIQDFRGMLNLLIEEYKNLIVGGGSGNLLTTSESISLQDDLVNRTAGLLKSLARYWRHEAKHPDLQDVVPSRATGRMLGEVLDILEHIALLVAEETPSSIGEKNRKHIRNITESSLLVATVLEKRIADSGLTHSAGRIYALVLSFRRQFRLKANLIKAPEATHSL